MGSSGSRFEGEVAATYRLMGYTVRTGAMLSGERVDMLVSYDVPGVKSTRVAVECRCRGELGKRQNVLTDLRGRFAHLVRKGEIDGVVVVTDRPIPLPIQKAATRSRVTCLTLSDLKLKALDVTGYLKRLAEMHQDVSDSLYIDIHVRTTDASSEHVSNATELVHDWIHRKKEPLFVLLGEFGTGKTTFCRRFVNDLARLYIDAPSSNRIPVFVPACSLGPTRSPYKAALEAMDSSRVNRASMRLVEQLNLQGVLLFVIDGVDELPPPRQASVLADIQHLAASPLSKILVTARPHFAGLSNVATRERGKKPQTCIATIEALDHSQVDEYLRKAFPQESNKGNALRSRLCADHGMLDIVQRPLFLGLLSTWMRRGEAPGDISIAQLYEAYVLALLRPSVSASGTKSSAAQLRFMTDIALRMFNSRETSIGPAAIASISRKVSRDIEASPLLTRDNAGRLAFVHKSFLEFFVARKLLDDIKERKSQQLSDTPLPRDILRFLADMNPPRRVLQEWIRGERTGPQSRVLSENASALLRIRTECGRRTVPRIVLRRLELSRIKCFEDVAFEFPTPDRTNNLFLLVGDNGVGKSTVLQSIALCAVGPDTASRLVPSPESFLRDGADEGFMRATFDLSNMPGGADGEVVVCLRIRRGIRRFELVTEGKHRSHNTKAFLEARESTKYAGLFIAAYGAGRRLDMTEAPHASLKEDPLMDRVCSLFDATKLLLSPRSLSRLVVGDGNPFRELGAPETLSSNAQSMVVKTLTSLLPEEERHGFTSEGLFESAFGRSSLAELSDGYRSTLAWAGHLIAHMLSSVGWSEDLEAVAGVVLIDEIDLHLHPKWQRIIVKQVRDTFPQLQFISCTHSPLVLADVNTHGGNAVLLRAEKDCVKAMTDLPSVRGWRADQILASELFGYIIDRDPTTESILREASVLSGRGADRTLDEESRYQRILDVLKETLVPEGQTAPEREAIQDKRREVVDKIQVLEHRIFGEGK